MGPGILLIHGYTGKPEDFGSLPDELARLYGPAAVRTLSLPGHGSAEPPRFEGVAFISAILAASAEFSELILICHSTGGTLALAALQTRLPKLRLMVLVGIPYKIDSAYLDRWSGHSPAGSALSLGSVAAMVSLVNRTSSSPIPGDFPVLLIQGEADSLVPCAEVLRWEQAFAGPVRTVVVPQGGHHLFQDTAAPFVRDLLLRALSDAWHRVTAEESQSVDRLIELEPEAARFFLRSPGSARHLAASPASLLLGGQLPALGEQAGCEPLLVNIEVTTRCNLRCAFCARTLRPGPEQDMPIEVFRRVLDLLPHAYRVTLVGLGEPLQHPRIAELVAEAVGRGRRVALVTNALELNAAKGKALLQAGLHTITFSLDAALQEVADLVRSGSDLGAILENIRAFGKLADGVRPLPRAIFTAVSRQTLPHLEQLVQKAALLGVDALMLSDLNFAANAANTLWRSAEDGARRTLRRAVRSAFSLGLPVLSVHGLEELGLAQRYLQHLLVPPSLLFERSLRRNHCCSPWQTLAVSVDGGVSVCDCQPEARLGNLLQEPFGELWQGSSMAGHRRQMLGTSPPAPCAGCPRF
jgi:MoaA/NifB/PqqE/SkfB family radical SAM enzyme/pimeloyl-ACP methyl ester carboxylesterase